MREVLATAGAVFLALTLHAQVQIPDFLRGKSGQQLRSVGIILPDTLKIWPSGPADGYVPTLKPFGQDLSEALLVIYPAPNPNGLCVIMCPGGGYEAETQDTEGHSPSTWFNVRGITYAMLQYRLPEGKHTYAPLSDAQQAIRILRGMAGEYGISKIGIIGCSAGGHLASSAATHYKEDCRPDFQILLYPVITMDPSFTHEGSRKALLGSDPSSQMTDLFSNEKQVTGDTPPAFIMACSDDNVVSVKNSVEYYLSLWENGVDASLHIYPSGGHGFGFQETFPYRPEFTAELDRWLREVILKQR